MVRFGPLVWVIGGGYLIFAHPLFNFLRFCKQRNEQFPYLRHEILVKRPQLFNLIERWISPVDNVTSDGVEHKRGINTSKAQAGLCQIHLHRFQDHQAKTVIR